MNGAPLDPAILDTRLLVLTRNLQRVKDAISGQQIDLQGRLHNYPVAADAWGRAFAKVVDIVGDELDEIEKLRKGIRSGKADGRTAWDQYGTHFAHASDICRDSVELLGGFALREQLVETQDDRLLNRMVCQYVEAIVGECASLAHPDLMPLLAIPAAEDPLAKTQARIIRVRFPEWTIWTLPLAAHEYCRATFEEVDALSKVLEHESARRGENENGASQQASDIVPLLIADAFALRMMGPAYACAAVLLRLDPFAHPSGPRTHDIERAETIFAVLERLYPAEGENEPRNFVAEHVQSHWGATLAAVAPDVDLEPIRKRAALFAEDGFDALDKKIRPEAHYGHEASGNGNDWRTAEKLRGLWQTEVSEVGVEGPPEPKPKKYGVRDVLNAAWSARLRNPGGALTFARKAAQECKGLLEATPESGGPLHSQKAEPSSGAMKR